MLEKIQKILSNIIRMVWSIVILLVGLCIILGICSFLYALGMEFLGFPALF